MLIAHFSSELLSKEQMIIPVKKKTFTNAGHIDAKLIDFSEICQKNEKPSEIGCLLLIVCWRSFPPKFPVKSADFPKNLPPKILRKLTFFRKNPAKWADFSANFDFSPAKISRNRPIVPRILTFFPRKCREIGRFFREFAPENPAKLCFFFREISEALSIMNFLWPAKILQKTVWQYLALWHKKRKHILSLQNLWYRSTHSLIHQYIYLDWRLQVYQFFYNCHMFTLFK